MQPRTRARLLIWLRSHRLLALFVARYGGLVLTLLGTLFLSRCAWPAAQSPHFSSAASDWFQKISASAAADKISMFHSGLDTMRSFRDFASVAAFLTMWCRSSLSHTFETCRAFVASPELASVTPPKCVLLMVASGTASIIQLPGVGWFSQIGLVAVALTGILQRKAEAATACATTLLVVTFLSIVPVGLIWAHFDHISLRKVTAESEHAEEELVAKEETGAAT